MKPQAKASNSFLGLYCHVPFCPHKCAYCAFYHESPKREFLDKYLDGIKKEITSINFIELPKTIFFGGGTPGILAVQDLKNLCQSISDISVGSNKLGNSNILEWTVEMAPSTVKLDKLQLMQDMGVTRISLGVQSFNPNTLEALGRRHSVNQVLQAYELIKKFSFDVNIDMMFSIPGQSIESWMQDLKQAIGLKPDHISTYCFTREEGTVFQKNNWTNAEEDQAQEIDLSFYEKTWEYLPSNRFHHYEISNFAQKNKECLHNLNTWNMGEWIGIGPAAASQYQNLRYNNPHSIDKWYQGITHSINFRENTTPLSNQMLAVDSLIFGLRQIEGVDLTKIAEQFEINLEKNFEEYFCQLQQNQLLIKDGQRIRLTQKGLLLADSIALEILEFLHF